MLRYVYAGGALGAAELFAGVDCVEVLHLSVECPPVGRERVEGQADEPRPRPRVDAARTMRLAAKSSLPLVCRFLLPDLTALWPRAGGRG